ncbi:Mitochondrial carrier protein [Lasiodiplodia theobromae]|uniref:Mitochondrial carrier protein n=1 Tax=Lasiodiplodia theobromae TaxID=45133 RepID=UPI0015C30430|nr:Mitochondrial carrier protein [Lasiodiplodia theobromae]KAF4533845.1 Mitochondrial carrier protein [Lasiodiplodia theobromae]
MDAAIEAEEEVDLEAKRPPYIHAMLAGGLGGLTGDMLMHSLDTVKTRQQGDPHIPPKYTSMGNTYRTIFHQEGFLRGLYGGVIPAFLGSFSGTVIFFGTYEWSKRFMVDAGIAPPIAYFSGGLLADLFAAPLYVPSEVLKTRLQLQGRYNNPYFRSGYNYRGTWHAARTIVRLEGWHALFHGFKATLARDLPFSALQFAFYEQEQKLAKSWVGSKDIGLPLEILTGATAGGMAGTITCPLDVVKTRIQTQQSPEAAAAFNAKVAKQKSNVSSSSPRSNSKPSKHSTPPGPGPGHGTPKGSKRPISTSSPSTSLKQHSAATLDTSSIIKGLRMIYKTEGVWGLFRGVGPRAVWTSVQSGTMLVLYQTLLRWFERHPLVSQEEL